MRLVLAFLLLVCGCGRDEKMEVPDLAPPFLPAKCNTIQLPSMPDVKVWPLGFRPVQAHTSCGLTAADGTWANFYFSYGTNIEDEYGRKRGTEEVKCLNGVPTLTLKYNVQIVNFQLTYILREKNANASFECGVWYSYVDYSGIKVGESTCKLPVEDVAARKVICRWESYP